MSGFEKQAKRKERRRTIRNKGEKCESNREKFGRMHHKQWKTKQKYVHTAAMVEFVGRRELPKLGQRCMYNQDEVRRVEEAVDCDKVFIRLQRIRQFN